MQLFRVKLKDPKSDPENNLDGYLCHNVNHKQLALYTLGSARQMASRWKGKSEKYGKEYTIDITKTIVILGAQLEAQITSLLNLNDERLIDAVFMCDQIQHVLKCKTLKKPLTEESKIELHCLIELIMPYDNVKIVWYQQK